MASPIGFIRETYTELKQVVWPTRNEVLRLTGVVLFISVFIGIYIGILDYVFTKITEFVVK